MVDKKSAILAGAAALTPAAGMAEDYDQSIPGVTDRPVCEAIQDEREFHDDDTACMPYTGDATIANYSSDLVAEMGRFAKSVAQAHIDESRHTREATLGWLDANRENAIYLALDELREAGEILPGNSDLVDVWAEANRSVFEREYFVPLTEAACLFAGFASLGDDKYKQVLETDSRELVAEHAPTYADFVTATVRHLPSLPDHLQREYTAWAEQIASQMDPNADYLTDLRAAIQDGLDFAIEHGHQVDRVISLVDYLTEIGEDTESLKDEFANKVAEDARDRAQCGSRRSAFAPGYSIKDAADLAEGLSVAGLEEELAGLREDKERADGLFYGD